MDTDVPGSEEERLGMEPTLSNRSLISPLLTFELNWLIEMWLDWAGFPLPQGDRKTPGFQPGTAWHGGGGADSLLQSDPIQRNAPERRRRRCMGGSKKRAFCECL